MEMEQYTYDNNSTRQDSTIKKYLEDWYDKNMKPYDEYIETSKFCNDTSTISDYIQYGASNRIIESAIPSFRCPNTTKNYGGLYKDSKIGLIAADEVMFAGGHPFQENYYYYLYGKSYDFWTFSPEYFVDDAYVMSLGYYGVITSWGVGNELALRPVINLRSDLPYTEGDGSYKTPYIVSN